MTPAGEILAAEIRRGGPIPFRRFMEVALYHPECGYYRRARDPFGKEGDFYTAEQMQPVFGILVAARIRQLFREMGEPGGFTVVELGAGRRGDGSGARGLALRPGGSGRRAAGAIYGSRVFQRVLRRAARGRRRLLRWEHSASGSCVSTASDFAWETGARRS